MKAIFKDLRSMPLQDLPGFLLHLVFGPWTWLADLRPVLSPKDVD